MKAPIDQTLAPRPLLALILLLCLAVAPHVQNLNPWLTGYFFLLAGWRLLALYQPAVLPGRFLLLLLSLAGIINIFMHQHFLFGKSAAIGLLTVMLGLKLMELKTQRDIYVTVLLSFFLLITHFLYNRSIALTAYLGLVVVGLTAVLVAINHVHSTKGPQLPLRKALVMLGQSLPIMLVLFFLFPRLGGPLWSWGVNETSAVSGLSDTITPGSISELILSDAIAFRADFDGELPPPQKRYWRGPVLWETDGQKWTTSLFTDPRPATYFPKGPAISYEIIMEPSQQKWLFALDLPVKPPPYSKMLHDFQIMARVPIKRSLRYNQSSHLDYTTGDISPEERQRGLQLPPNISQRMRQLVADWGRATSDKSDIVNAALGHFNQQPFVYTLSPPLLGDNPADQFLFETRRGFCEHFATSFTLLMRIAGIPARVVTGYQGGEYNPHGGYLIVQQSDAHAWAEVWLEGPGWVRVDPTAAVAPQRVERSLDTRTLGEGTPAQFQLLEPGPMASLLKQMRWGLDAINTSWNRWILGYSNKRQSELLSMLSLDFLKGKALGIGMVVITSIIVLTITLSLLIKGRSTTDPTVILYQRFCNKLGKRGLVRQPNEGPNDYAERVIQKRPDLKIPIERITRLYIAIRYGRLNTRTNRNNLRRMVRGFHPKH
jgi:transglutaminase-like putative cysteine protease